MRDSQIEMVEQMYIMYREGRTEVNFAPYIPDLIKTIRVLKEKENAAPRPSASNESISLSVWRSSTYQIRRGNSGVPVW